ncbi:hypothetical protein Csa_022628 [Cucumis sativus]|uniref:Uncharacterized protein n=1 Tax=Cucumis sativus TaxID=3659 RepID=A0A0A0LNA9_CUCSA|nr:hypothetical protein Csa_022628 [Cucumis sativus]
MPFQDTIFSAPFFLFSQNLLLFFSITYLKTFTIKPHHNNHNNNNINYNIMRHLCLLSLLLLPLLLPTTTSNLLVHGRALQPDATVEIGSHAHEFKLKPKDDDGGGDSGGGGSDTSNQRVFTLASGPSRRGDGHK